MTTMPSQPKTRLAFNIKPGEAYTIRRKVLKLLGAAFHIYDPQGGLVGYCKQKAFKLKEDIRIYTDESMKTEWLVIKARSVLDFGATYDIQLPDGSVIGSLRRKGLKSTLLRDSWMVFDPAGAQIAALEEDGGSIVVLARRYIDYVSLFFPQKFVMKRMDGTVVARYRQHFNLLVYRLSIAVEKDDPELDDLMIMAAGCVIAAIEGRQDA